MSIASALPIDPWTCLFGAWLIGVLVIAWRTGWWRPRPAFAQTAPVPADEAKAFAPPLATDKLIPYARPIDDPWRQVPQLAVAALVSFMAWVGTQVIYLSVRHPSATLAGGEASWSAADLTRLSLLSAAVGWCVGYGLILAGRGTAAVGYGWRRFPAGMLAGVIGLLSALPVVYAVLQLTLWVLAHFGVDHPPKHELLQVLDGPASRWVRWGATFAAVVAAPLFEELLFRGFVQGGLRRATRSPWAAILVTSTLFAAIHPKWTIPPIFVFSVLLGIVYERSRNLWATTVMHALFNAISVISS